MTIPAALYAGLYAQHKEETSDAILSRLLGSVSSEPADRPQYKYPEPGKGTKTGRVWEIADRKYEENKKADWNSVVRACIDEDINVNTASTQYSYWKKTRGH